jgi:hypothetical protein
MPKTTLEQLTSVQTAIEEIELYGQSHSIKDRTFTGADLNALYKREERLKALYARESRGGSGGARVTYGRPAW